MPPKSASLVATFGDANIVLQMYGVKTLHDASHHKDGVGYSTGTSQRATNFKARRCVLQIQEEAK